MVCFSTRVKLKKKNIKYTKISNILEYSWCFKTSKENEGIKMVMMFIIFVSVVIFIQCGFSTQQFLSNIKYFGI